MHSLASLFQKAPAVMGILNLTPDSFSDGGKYLDSSFALEHVLKMQEEGMDCLDVGAESTRPGAEEVSEAEQLKRLENFFEKILPCMRVPVSIDTRNPRVAKEAFGAGVSIINDVSALSYDEAGMLQLLQESDVAYVLMHSRGNPQTMKQFTHYENIFEDLHTFFEMKLALLDEHQVKRERIILDPGIGFAKEASQSLEILSNFKWMKKFGCPILMGVSRKSFLKDFFGSENRSVGTELSHWIALENGAQILRVHDVKSAKQTINFFKQVNHYGT